MKRIMNLITKILQIQRGSISLVWWKVKLGAMTESPTSWWKEDVQQITQEPMYGLGLGQKSTKLNSSRMSKQVMMKQYALCIQIHIAALPNMQMAWLSSKNQNHHRHHRHALSLKNQHCHKIQRNLTTKMIQLKLICSVSMTSGRLLVMAAKFTVLSKKKVALHFINRIMPTN